MSRAQNIILTLLKVISARTDVNVCVISRVNPLAKSLNLRSNCVGVEAKSALRAAWGMRDSDELKL